MKTSIITLWTGAARIAVFFSFLMSLLSPQSVIASPPPVISVQPLGQTVAKHANVTFSVIASSATTMTYQWYNKAAGVNIAITGATQSSYTITNVASANAGTYNVSVINAGGTKKSSDVVLTVNNIPPVANNDAFTTIENTPMTNGVAPAGAALVWCVNLLQANAMNISAGIKPASVVNPSGVLDNDTDADGDALTAKLIQTTSNGLLTFYSNGTFNYIPNSNFVGNDSFTYVANDGTTNSGVATVNISVIASVSGGGAIPPDAVTLDAAGVFSTTAGLNASINPHGNAASYYFQYGTSTNYGFATAPTSRNAGTNMVSASTFISGLTPGSTYHYSIVATGPGGITAGNDVAFTTTLYDATPIVVTTNGPGGVSPALSGQSLIIGQSYTMIAAPSVGCSFLYWRDGNGIIYSTNSSLTFLMASNLVFNAVFADTTKPTLTVTAPTTAAVVSNEFFTASGKASDNISVTNVSYQLNGSSWYPASPSNNWTNWTVVLDLYCGTNIFSVCAVDTAGNICATNTVKFVYLTAPTVLLKNRAMITLDSGPTYEMAFGTNTFSQFSNNTNVLSSVGNFTFTKNSANSGTLKLTYVAPPQGINVASQSLNLLFTSPTNALFSNTTLGLTGSMSFSAVTNLAPATLAKFSTFFVSANGGAISNAYSTTNVLATDLISRSLTKWTNYTYTYYSPLVSLIKERSTNSMTYWIADFLTTNSGLYYQESYDNSGAFRSVDAGSFGIASQRAGGNAPTNLINCNLSFAAAAGNFKLSMGTSAFAQFCQNPNYSCGIGNYLYARQNTNLGAITLDYSAPAAVSGATSSAYLLFVAANWAIYTNADGTYGCATLGKTLASAPTDVSGLTVNAANNVDGSNSQFTFYSGGTFTVSGSQNSSGTFSYSVLSPESGLTQLTFTSGDFSGSTAYLQIDFGNVISGCYFPPAALNPGN